MGAMDVKNLKVTITLDGFLSSPTKESILKALKKDLKYGVENYTKDDKVIVNWEEIESSVQEALNNIKEFGSLDKVNAAFSRLMQARTFEEFTDRKRSYMIALVSALPTSTDKCAYCIEYGCEDCPYGKEHKICYMEGSVYKKLIDARDNLYMQICEY